MVHGGMTIIKYLLFIFNFVFVVCGIALISVGAVAKTSGSRFTEFLGSKFFTAPTILIVIGCIVFLVAFMGCCGAVKENYCMVMTFGVLLFLIFVIELAGGITAYVHKGELKDFLKKEMSKSFDQGKDKDMWIDMQKSLKCCGVDGPEDYFNSTFVPEELPKSCCDEDHCSNKTYFRTGCFDKANKELMKEIGVVGGVAIGVGVVELLGVIFAFCLGSAIKKEYEGV